MERKCEKEGTYRKLEEERIQEGQNIIKADIALSW
jgi:hypothetical protein